MPTRLLAAAAAVLTLTLGIAAPAVAQSTTVTDPTRDLINAHEGEIEGGSGDIRRLLLQHNTKTVVVKISFTKLDTASEFVSTVNLAVNRNTSTRYVLRYDGAGKPTVSSASGEQVCTARFSRSSSAVIFRVSRACLGNPKTVSASATTWTDYSEFLKIDYSPTPAKSGRARLTEWVARG